MGPGAFVGDDDLLFDRSRLATAISISSETVTYYISKEVIITFLAFLIAIELGFSLNNETTSRSNENDSRSE